MAKQQQKLHTADYIDSYCELPYDTYVYMGVKLGLSP